MMREKRPNISSVVYVIARCVELSPWCSRSERDKQQIVGTGLRARCCYRRKCAVFPISVVKGLTYLQIRILAAPVANCDYIHRVYILYPVALPFTSLLLVFRAVALYKNNKYVTAFFALSWLVLLANSIAFSSGIVGMQIENTPYCMETNFKRYAIVGMISPAIHDTLIFVATTWVFVGNSSAEINLKNAFKVMVTGRHLLAFSKSLLRDGQLYFLWLLFCLTNDPTLTLLLYS